MKKILFSIGIASFLMSCSSLKEDIYKDYNARHKLEKVTIIEKIVEKEIKVKDTLDKSLTNDEILSNDNLKNKIFDRSLRKINKNLKGVWVATVTNLDFPKSYNLEEQKLEIINIMENVSKWGLNAVFFQVRPAADAFYNSNFEPWSIYLTGVQNQNPGFDPLAFAIEEAHKRGIELHAWINPYRASMNLDMDKLSDKSVVKKNPDWVFEFDGKFYLNPGNKEVVRYVSNAIEEIVANYDVDGVHLDDYFYPYPSATKKLGDNFDEIEYDKYGKNLSKDDWRRENVNNMIANLSVSVHKIKPSLSFGISPFGIWRNIDTDVNGSKTKGLQSYDALYADSIKWMKNAYIDYIAPQIYWNIGYEKADYEELAKWWNEKSLETNTPLYIGHGIYKHRGEWKDENETAKQLYLNKGLEAVNGSIFFRYETLLNNTELVDQIKNNLR